jgi:hypothetical protein
MLAKRIVTLAGAAASAIAISACGAGEHATYADNLGPGYVQVGQLNYQVQVSRELNPWDKNEDAWYLTGFSPSQLALPTSELFFGVSLQVFNWTKHPSTPTSDFYITDTVGERFTPMVNANPNPYSYVAASIPSGGRLPNVSSNAFSGWTQGEFIVFKIPYASIVSRPFILHIVNQAQPVRQSQIELDI